MLDQRRPRTGQGHSGHRVEPSQPGRPVTPEREAAIRAVMHSFVEDGLASGVPASRRITCDACCRSRPATGFIAYEQYVVCNDCATDYEVSRARTGAVGGRVHAGPDSRHARR